MPPLIRNGIAHRGETLYIGRSRTKKTRKDRPPLLKCRGCSESVPAASSVPKYERLGYRRGTPSHAAGKCAVKLDFSGVMGLTWIGPCAGFERKVHIILACPMALDPSADLSSPSVGSPYDSLRIRIPKSESPPGLDLQTDASSAHDFILQFTFQKIKSQKTKTQSMV